MPLNRRKPSTMWYESDRTPIHVYAAERPRFSKHGGKTWDAVSVFINGETKETRLCYDSSRGMNYYFARGGRWYRIPMFGKHGLGADIGYHARLGFDDGTTPLNPIAQEATQ